MNTRTMSAVGALLLAGSVAAELAWPDLGDAAVGEALLPSVNALGWSLVAWVVRRLPATSGRRSRIGRGCLLAGCLLQILFGLGYAASAVALDDPAEVMFVLLALGFLLLLVGGLALGRVYWRRGQRLLGAGLRLVALLGLIAIAVGADPWHDVALLSSYAAWALVGAGAQTARRIELEARVEPATA